MPKPEQTINAEKEKMKVFKLTSSKIASNPKTAANITTLNDQELTSIKQVCTQLKSACPGLGPLIHNPNNMAVLMRFFQIIGENQSAITLLRNSLATIKKAMDKDSTTTTGFVSSI
jgi:hypothetical protein